MSAKKKVETKAIDSDYLHISKKEKYLVFLLTEDANGNLDNLSVIRNNLNYFEELGLISHHQHALVTDVSMDKVIAKYLAGVQEELNNTVLLTSIPNTGQLKN